MDTQSSTSMDTKWTKIRLIVKYTPVVLKTLSDFLCNLTYYKHFFFKRYISISDIIFTEDIMRSATVFRPCLSPFNCRRYRFANYQYSCCLPDLLVYPRTPVRIRVRCHILYWTKDNRLQCFVLKRHRFFFFFFHSVSYSPHLAIEMPKGWVWQLPCNGVLKNSKFRFVDLCSYVLNQYWYNIHISYFTRELKKFVAFFV